MCGIFGIISIPGNERGLINPEVLLKKIAIASESRGKDSSGIAFRENNSRSIHVIKGDVPISQLLKSDHYENIAQDCFTSYRTGHSFAAIGHARLVTNGSQLEEVNNQPVIKEGMVMIHNGIIVNADELWKHHPNMLRNFKIDTEIIPALIKEEIAREENLSQACINSFSKLEGTFSVSSFFEDFNLCLLATNNGSLYYTTDHASFFIFASESYFLKVLMKDKAFRTFNKKFKVLQLSANKALLIELDTLEIWDFPVGETDKPQKKAERTEPFPIRKYLLENQHARQEVVIDPMLFINRSNEKRLFSLLEYNIESISKLLRCIRCLLPETFPFIHFDHLGICNYCNNYKPSNLCGSVEDLKAIVDPYRSKNGIPDCIVPFSGGRDSTYTLHIVKKELGLNPIAFTYDWGMVTDLARRNIARVCGKMGVENIIVSADIRWKRKNIRDNIIAWMKYPSLGMIPLFMAGDKFFFQYTNELKKKTGIKLNIWGINNLENTEFKTGFAGLPPAFDKKRIYSLTFQNQLKLFGFIAKNIIKSPGYLNQSVFDNLGSFASRYLIPKSDYYHLFDYYRWDESAIFDLIKHEYNWETAIDTTSTWRVGDGTASFYNYIYFTVAGFSEHDTFRSNQIREGMLTREKALKLAEQDNYPRYETLRWYFEIIGLNFEEIIKRVNSIPKLYPIDLS